MKPATIVGILLIVIGAFSFVYSGITVSRHKKIIDIGPIEVHETKKERIPLPPVLGGIALVGGIVLVAAGARKG